MRKERYDKKCNICCFFITKGLQKIIDTDEKLGRVQTRSLIGCRATRQSLIGWPVWTSLEHLHSIKTDKRVTNIPESYLKEDELKVALFRRQNQKGNQTIVNEQFNKEFLEYWKKIRKIFYRKFRSINESLRRVTLFVGIYVGCPWKYSKAICPWKHGSDGSILIRQVFKLILSSDWLRRPTN